MGAILRSRVSLSSISSSLSKAMGRISFFFASTIVLKSGGKKEDLTQCMYSVTIFLKTSVKNSTIF